MQNILEQLEQVLTAELELHEEFIISAREFNRVIRDEDLDGIDRQRTVQDETVCRIEKLEKERRSCCSMLARSLGIVREPLKMRMLLEKVPRQWRERLGGLQETLKKAVGELSKITTSNRILLEEGLRVVQSTYAYVQQTAGSRYAPYGQHGRTVRKPLVQSIINKTA